MILLSDLFRLFEREGSSYDADRQFILLTILSLWVSQEIDIVLDKRLTSPPDKDDIASNVGITPADVQFLTGGSLSFDNVIHLIYLAVSSGLFHVSSHSRAIKVSSGMSKVCQYHCCSETVNLEKDHILPYSVFGISDEWNGQWLCRKHNLRKGNSIDLTSLQRSPLHWN